MNRVVIVLLSLLLNSCYLIDEELPEDQNIWEYDQPGNVGMQESTLLLIDNLIKQGDFEFMESMLIIKDSKIVFENFYESNRRPTLVPQLRSTTLFASIGIGLLIKDGFIQNLNTPIVNFLPEYVEIFNATPDKRNITLKHLLNHTTGLLWDEINISYQSPENYLTRMTRSEEWVEFVLDQPLDAPPGLRVTYNSGSAMVISKIIENLTQKSAEDYLSEKLFEPLEITNWTWENGVGAQTNLSNGLFLSTIDMAKIGYLYLNDGFWEGQEILSANWIRTTTSSENNFSNLANYAMNWWNFADELSFVSEFEQNDIYYFSNEAGTHLYIVPHLNMVVSISAANFFYGFSNPTLIVFLNVMDSA